jgi:hypothetical protein
MPERPARAAPSPPRTAADHLAAARRFPRTRQGRTRPRRLGHRRRALPRPQRALPPRPSSCSTAAASTFPGVHRAVGDAGRHAACCSRRRDQGCDGAGGALGRRRRARRERAHARSRSRGLPARSWRRRTICSATANAVIADAEEAVRRFPQRRRGPASCAAASPPDALPPPVVAATSARATHEGEARWPNWSRRIDARTAIGAEVRSNAPPHSMRRARTRTSMLAQLAQLDHQDDCGARPPARLRWPSTPR